MLDEEKVLEDARPGPSQACSRLVGLPQARVRSVPTMSDVVGFSAIRKNRIPAGQAGPAGK
jgi:hypothetical protein